MSNHLVVNLQEQQFKLSLLFSLVLQAQIRFYKVVLNLDMFGPEHK